MMQTGRLFKGGIEHPHFGCGARKLKGPHAATCRRTSCCRVRSGNTGGNLPHGQTAGFLGKALRPVRAERRPLRRRTSKSPTCCRPITSRRSAWTAGGDWRAGDRRVRQAFRDSSQDAELLDANFDQAYTLMTSSQGARGVRPQPGDRRRPRALRPQPLRPELPAGAAAGRARRAVRDRQHVRDRVQRDHLGHPRLGAVQPDQLLQRTGGPDVRQRLHRAARGSEPARAARQHAGAGDGRVRPHAARSTRRAAATTGRNAGPC